MTTLGFALALWVMLSSLLIPLARLRARQALPAAVIGMVIAHFGVGLTTLGITGVQSFKIEKDFALAVGEAASIGGYDFRFAALRDVRRLEFHGRRGGHRRLARRRSRSRYCIRRSACTTRGGNPMTEAGIEVGPARDLFAALGDDLGQGRWSVRLQYKPLIRYIWLGAILIALGGVVAAFDRRYRVRVRAHAVESVATVTP